MQIVRCGDPQPHTTPRFLWNREMRCILHGSMGQGARLSEYAGWYFRVYVLVRLLRGNPPRG